jgi:hypothetical protein
MAPRGMAIIKHNTGNKKNLFIMEIIFKRFITESFTACKVTKLFSSSSLFKQKKQGPHWA